ncbi:MAG: TonB-dependent receptor, partial [Gammaproteobacteria bacterium]
MKSVSVAASGLLLAVSASVHAGHATEELLVTGRADPGVVAVDEVLQSSPDTGALLRDVPGASLQANGPLSGRVQIRGLAGDRVSVMLDGAHVSSGCTNAMDPPLHYAPAVLLESLQVYRGIVPVSLAQESIGGAVTTTAWNGPFASEGGVVSAGRLLLSGQDINHGHSASLVTSVANRNHRLRVAGLNEEGDDSEFPGGELLPTEYHRERADIGYAYQRDGHFLSVDGARNDSTNVGTPALPMDVSHIDSDLSQLQYRFTEGDWQVSTRVFRSDVNHGMTNYHLRV